MIKENLNTYLNLLANNKQLNGSVLVAYKGEILINNGYGYANFAYNIPNTSKTKFRIGSITKGFTALAIMILEEMGLLHVEDPISKYIPEYPNGDLITIHHLLTHTSGIFNYVEHIDFWHKEMRLHTPTIDALIELFKDQPSSFLPGEGFYYTNSEYILLEKIIEQVSNLSYEEFIKVNILDKIGATDTGIDNGRTVINNMAIGYSLDKTIVNAEFADMSKARGAYGMVSTVEDLYKWDRALYNETLVTHSSLKKIFTKYHEFYGGYGWNIGDKVIHKIDRRCMSHLGDLSGFISIIDRYVDLDLVVIVLSNLGITQVEELSLNLAKLTLEEPIVFIEECNPIKLSNEELLKYQGTYTAINSSEKLIIEYEDYQLYLNTQKRYGVWYKYKLKPIKIKGNETIFMTDLFPEYLTFKHENNSLYLEFTDIFNKFIVFEK